MLNYRVQRHINPVSNTFRSKINMFESFSTKCIDLIDFFFVAL